MSDLMPYGYQLALRRSQSRQVSRALSGLELHTRMASARIEAAAEVQALKADAVTYVGKRAMQDVAMISQLEHQLASLVPLAAGRLQAIADMTSLSIAEVVADTLRQVR